MALQPSLTCPCRPDFVYKTRASFQAHVRSARHVAWEDEAALRDARLTIVRLEAENLRLKRVIDELIMRPAGGQVATRSLTAAQKKRVAASQRWTCNECREVLDENYEIDHIHPLARGGSNAVQNLQALCRACHAHKTERQRVRRVDP